MTTAYQPNTPPDPKRTSKSKRGYKRLPDNEDYPPIDLNRFGVTASKTKTPIGSVDQLRNAVLDEQQELRQIEVLAQKQTEMLQNHNVLQLMSERFHSYSAPGNRQDNATLALAMEGGGMRGCVSAGMAAAIASLGLTDTIDVIYGSSAGSVIGAYMVSRQMCVDVYVDILPAAKEKFVCKNRLVRSIASSLVDTLLKVMGNNMNFSLNSSPSPGMNISYVLDGIMGQDQGIRPLDLKRFEENNKKQPLRVVSSCIDSKGNMFSKCFGHSDFFDETATTCVGSKRQGLEACLDASMTVPGATGPPVIIWNATTGEKLPCFDAFCFEPIPYRSAVEEGATHVLALLTRPDGFQPKTTPGVYEQVIAPLYFNSHGRPKVSEYFEQGGQQYLYAEDLLLLEEGKLSSEKVLVPPSKILYGAPQTSETQELIKERERSWKKAHLLPIKVPFGTPELPTLENDKEAVLNAVRGGFSAAFDILSPIAGLDMDISGEEAAKLIFPNNDGTTPSCEQTLLRTKVNAPGYPIGEAPKPLVLQTRTNSEKGGMKSRTEDSSHALLMNLPGLQDGRFCHLAKALRYNSGIKMREMLGQKETTETKTL